MTSGSVISRSETSRISTRLSPGLTSAGSEAISTQCVAGSAARDSVGAASPRGSPLSLTVTWSPVASWSLRMRIGGLASGDQVTVKLNGKSLGAAAPEEPLATEPATHWVELEPEPKLVNSGDNLIAVQLTTERELPAPLVMDSLILSLRYE